MNDLLSQLKDIEGLDAISWWPLASGWWLLLALLVAVPLGLLLAIALRKFWKNRWQRQILRHLDSLQKANPTKETYADLSETLKRLAIKRFGRQSCAGLEGTRWLQWLTQNDPKNFDWKEKGRALISLPYAPASQKGNKKELQQLIQATKRWVR
ncbi:MAG: DUF4381 domain-containing protein [Alphaproteobacteria bacterium]|nr:DUF4381 domain-containing protein [Alphaproteobacteria bacterium]MBT5389239.1 DUF4381 domain-containing protein [Alphaproteobacteria bacterium]MBT5540161.1 DUF4381 domain-containing protein [Alphaproteobacteria bacterium]